MKRFYRMMLFTVVCAMLMAMSAQAVNAQALECSAKAAIVIDTASGEAIYGCNAYERLPMASTTKIMSALIALESGELDESFVVDSEAIKVEGSSMGLQEGDIVTMRALVCGMLLPSGNDAANAAAVRIAGSVEGFVQLMNERAEAMGLEDTHFVTPSGLDDDTDEHYSTAHDMAILAAAALENEDFAAICSKQYIKLSYGNPPYERWLTNTNKLLDSCEGVIGVKTGFTDKAKRCLVSACQRNGATLVCVTLNDPSDWSDHAAIYDYAFERMQEYCLEDVCEVSAVAGGQQTAVNAVCEGGSIMLPEGVGEEVEARVILKPLTFAPVSEGEPLGEVRYYYNDKLLRRAELTAQSDISAAPSHEGGWRRLLRTINSLLEEK